MGPSLVRVQGRRLMVARRGSDGTLAAEVPYDMKGIAWSPNGEGEAFDGAGHLQTTHAAEDAALMQAAHINTVRTYGPMEISDDGIAALDVLHAHGIMVAMTVFAALDDGRYTQAVNRFKDHPAVLMWLVGNEWNYNKLYSNVTTEEAAARVNEVITAVAALDPNHPVGSVYGEMPQPDTLNLVPAAQVWGVNLYPQLSFATRFDDWKARSPLPLFVAEYGADAYNRSADAGPAVDEVSQAHAVSVLTGLIRAHLSATSADEALLGGCVFEWNDEWWKGGNPAQQDTGGFANGGVYPDEFAHEEWWGVTTASRQLRQAYLALQAAYE